MRTLKFLPVCLFVAAGLSAGPAEDDPIVFISLKAKANHKLDEEFHPGARKQENTLASFPTGVKKLGGIKFKIEAGILQLGSLELRDKPEKIEGIAVNRKLAKLHIVHGTGWGSAAKGETTHVPEDTVIGKYVIHYEDKSKAEIEIAYGRDVRDWWFLENETGADRSKVAWVGENPASKQAGKKLRVYLTTWENPKPDKKIVTIDYITTQAKETAAAPFCIAMTGEAAK